MNFNSVLFFGFLGVVYSTYLLLPHKSQNRFLLAASYIFYACWDWRFLGLILASTSVDYVVGLGLSRSHEANGFKRRGYLAASLVANLGMLGFFKYHNFFVDSLIDLGQLVGLELGPRALSIALPVGISFYTFQTLSYTIDVYRGRTPATRDFFDFALYVAYFPQLVAGPIERSSRLLPRIQSPRSVDYDSVSRGAVLILVGLFKKVAVADGMAVAVDSVFGATGGFTAADVVLASYAFCIQIYCDFSGYSDIARGVSRLFGIELMLNFRTPLFSLTPAEFWTRWHISLSSWFRDYVYIPLGGSHRGELRTYFNLMFAFFWGGLWHGAAWNFVLWGIYHGALVCIWRAVRFPIDAVRKSVLLIALTFAFHFQLIAYGRLLFRATSLHQVLDFTRALLPGSGASWTDTVSFVVPPAATLSATAVLLALDLSTHLRDDDEHFTRWSLPIRTCLYAALLVFIVLGLRIPTSEFVYFQF